MDPVSAIPYGRKTQHAPALKEVHILWITAGLGCDGDSVSITAATQPSIAWRNSGTTEGSSAQSGAGL
jgi:hydrogenase small subunit